jgi:predicted HicB family RNase H-like nuclease
VTLQNWLAKYRQGGLLSLLGRATEPSKPFSGKLPFRTTVERHRQIYLAAKKANKSINSWMDDTLAEALS